MPAIRPLQPHERVSVPGNVLKATHHCEGRLMTDLEARSYGPGRITRCAHGVPMTKVCGACIEWNQSRFATAPAAHMAPLPCVFKANPGEQTIEDFRKVERRMPEMLGSDVTCKRCDAVAPRHIGIGRCYDGNSDLGLVPNIEGWTVAMVWIHGLNVAMPKTNICPDCAPALLRSKADEAKEREAKHAAESSNRTHALDKILAKEMVLMREAAESGPGIEKTRDAMHETYVLDEDLLCADID